MALTWGQCSWVQLREPLAWVRLLCIGTDINHSKRNDHSRKRGTNSYRHRFGLQWVLHCPERGFVSKD